MCKYIHMEQRITKTFITPEQLRLDSFKLAKQIVESGSKPDSMVAVWRGGTFIGCCVHEFLKYKNIEVDHIAIRTSKYTGIDKCTTEVNVHNLGYLLERLKPGDTILLVDDVWDTGLTIKKIKECLMEKGFPDITIKVATVYYKPTKNVTDMKPDYFIHETKDWLVFPHELEGMDINEIETNLGKAIADLIR